MYIILCIWFSPRRMRWRKLHNTTYTHHITGRSDDEECMFNVNLCAVRTDGCANIMQNISSRSLGAFYHELAINTLRFYAWRNFAYALFAYAQRIFVQSNWCLQNYTISAMRYQVFDCKASVRFGFIMNNVWNMPGSTIMHGVNTSTKFGIRSIGI